MTRAPRGGALLRELGRLRQQIGDSVRIFIGGQGAAACEQPTNQKDFLIFSNISDFTACIGFPGSARKKPEAPVRLETQGGPR
jgi:hypothetical protein